jgi:hypothetical protein
MWGVLEAGGELDLPLEALGPERAGEIGVQHLECDRTLVPEVLGEEDGRHAAPPELALEGVGRGESSLQLGAQVGQVPDLRGTQESTRRTGTGPAAVGCRRCLGLAWLSSTCSTGPRCYPRPSGAAP